MQIQTANNIIFIGTTKIKLIEKIIAIKIPKVYTPFPFLKKSKINPQKNCPKVLHIPEIKHKNVRK